MPSTYSTRLRFELIGLGEQSGTWGTTANTTIGTLIEEAIAGVASVTMTDADYTLVSSNGSTDEARQAVLEIAGVLTTNRNVICPTQEKKYVVKNATTGGFTITLKTSGGTGIAIASGKKMAVYCDGTNVVDQITALSSGTTVGGATVATLTGSETLTNKTLTSPTVNTPTITTPVISGTWTFTDNTFVIQDNADTTKKLSLQLSSIATGTTRTWTAPDADLTIVGLATTQTLQNKTHDSTNTYNGGTFTSNTLTTPVLNSPQVNDKSVTIASASTMNIGAAAGTYIDVTGAVTITAFDTVQAGVRRVLRFAGAPQITHSATTTILPGAQNLPVQAGDTVEFTSEGSGNWRCTDLIKAATPPPVGRKVLAAKTGSYTGVIADDGGMIRYTGTGGHTFTLPTSGVPTGYRLTLRNDSTTSPQTSVALDPTGAATLDGQATRNLFPGDSCSVTFDGTNYFSDDGRWMSIPADQAAPVAGSVLTFAHGLGAIPRVYQPYLVCTTNNASWLVNDVVQYASAQQNFGGSSDKGVSVYADATNVYVVVGSAASYLVLHNKGTGASTNLVIGSWSFRIVAQL